MTSLIKKAKKGNKDAFIELYEANKQEVLYLCEILLCGADAADNAFIYVFKSAWEHILDGKIDSEQELQKFLISKAVNHCKHKISKNDSRAFKIPQGKNFTVSSYSLNNIHHGEEPCYSLLAELPAIHRFIYVLDAYLGWSEGEIAELLHTNADTIRCAFFVRQSNFDRFSYALEQEINKPVNISEESFKSFLLDGRDECKASGVIDFAIESSIDTVIAPMLKVRSERRKRGRLIAVIVAISTLVVAGGVVGGILLSQRDEEEFEPIEWITSVEEPTHYAVIDIADHGKLTVALDGNTAPKTVENFVELAKSGFYDGLTFHRIVEDFMMQGGDPAGDGTGGNTDENGNEINLVGEFYLNGYDNFLSHKRGAISMARTDDYNSASSQFFIVHQEYYIEELDGRYAAFGYVIDGMDIVDTICENAEPTDYNGTIEKDAQPVINSIKIYTPEEYDAIKQSESGESEAESEY